MKITVKEANKDEATKFIDSKIDALVKEISDKYGFTLKEKTRPGWETSWYLAKGNTLSHMADGKIAIWINGFRPNGEFLNLGYKVAKGYTSSVRKDIRTFDTLKKNLLADCEAYFGSGASESKKSEAYEDIWRGADVMTFDEACEQLDLPADRLQDFIDEYGENWDEDPDAMNEYVQRVDDFVFSCFDQDFVSIDGEEIPLGLCREPKVLIVQDIDHKGGDKAVELVKKLANGELTGSSDDGDYVAIMDGVHGSPHFDIYSEGDKPEGGKLA